MGLMEEFLAGGQSPAPSLVDEFLTVHSQPAKKPSLVNEFLAKPNYGQQTAQKRQKQEQKVKQSQSWQNKAALAALVGLPGIGAPVAGMLNPEMRGTGIGAFDALSGAAAESFTKPYYDFTGRENLGAKPEELLAEQVQQRALDQGRDLAAESQPGATAEELWQRRMAPIDPQDRFANQRVPKMSREDVRYEQAGLDPEVFGQRAVDLRLGAVPLKPRKESKDAGLQQQMRALLGAEEQAQTTAAGATAIHGSAAPIPTMYDVATARGADPVEAMTWEVLADPLEMTGLGLVKGAKGINALRDVLGAGDELANAAVDGLRIGGKDIARQTETVLRGRPKSTAAMSRELRQAKQAEPEQSLLDEFLGEDARFSYEEDTPTAGKSIAQMRAEMRQPLPPEPAPAGGKSASQLRAEMAQGNPVRQAVPELNPDLPIARLEQPDPLPRGDLSYPALSVDQLDQARRAEGPGVSTSLLDEFLASRGESPTPQSAPLVEPPAPTAPKLSAVPKSPEKPSWQQPTPKNVDKWKTTVAQHDALTEPKIRQAVAAGGDEAQWRAHYRELEPSSVRFARQGLEEAYAPRISPKTWTEKFAPGAIRVEANGKVTNVLLSLEERQMWKFQSPAERQAALESRALGAKATPREHLYTPPKEVSEEELAQEAGIFEGPRQSRPGKQLEEFRARRAAEKPPTPEQEAATADRAARQDEFHRRSLELVQAHTPVSTGKGRLKAEALAFDEQGRPHVDMGQRRYFLTDLEAKYYNDMPPDVDRTEWLKQRQFTPKPPRYRANNALPEGQVEIPETAVDELIPEGSPIKGKPVRGRGPVPKPERTPEPERSLVDEFLGEPAREAPSGPRQAPDEDTGILETVDPSTIKTDAKTYQYKSGADASGVTGRLKSVEGGWKRSRSGKIVVHERLNGERFVADGHQRHDLATRAQQAGQSNVQMDAMVYREADGWTPEDIRLLAAQKNMAEDSGTAIDAAKIIKMVGADHPDIKSLPRTSKVVRDGTELAKLSPRAFEEVVNELVSPELAAHVGKHITDPAEQVAAMRTLKRLRPADRAEAESIVQDIKMAGFARKNEGLPDNMEQGGLFEGFDEVEDLLSERAQVMAATAKRIKEDKALFNKLVKGEGRATEAGNKLDRAANEARLSEDERILRGLQESKYVGAVNDALNTAARQVRKGGKSLKSIIDDFSETVGKHFEGGAGNRGQARGAESLDSPGAGPRAGLDFEPDAPSGPPATGWDAARPPQSIGNRKLTAAQREQWPDLTAAERKEMLGIKPAGKVGMDFQAEQMELGYTVNGEQVKLGQSTTVKELPVPAIVRFVKETTGSYPNVTEALRALGKKMGGTVRGRVVGRSIQLNPELLQDIGKLAKVLAHEIGHLPDLLPWAAKGINGGIGDIRKGMRGWLKSLPADVRRELWEASKHWRPIDEARASAGQLRYRKDVEETFADAISMMFNDPDRLQKMAPKFWKQFTEQLDKTPKLKQSIADVHAWRSGTLQDLTGELRQQIRTDMVRGEDLFKALQAEALQREQSLIFRLHQNWGAIETGFLDEGGVWKAWADRLERQGLTVPEHIDPRIHYDAYQMTDGPTAQVAKHANEKILQPLREAGIDEHLAGEWLQNQAIADGHRANIANPRGVTSKEAAEALRQIESQLTPEQLKTLKSTAKEARSMFWDALEEAVDAGRLDRATLERLRKNKDSLTPMLQVENLHANLDETIASIETGSFQEAKNPLIGMIQQTLAIRGEARRNKARQVMLDFVREFAPEEILAKPRKGTKPFSFHRDGVKESHHVDAYLEDLFQTSTTRELDAIGKLLDGGTGAFLKLWLRWNPGFYAGQAVMDAFKSARNLASVGLYRAWDPSNLARVGKSWAEAFRPALDYAREVPNDLISKMIDEQAILPADLSLTNQLAGDALGNAGQLETVLAQAGINTQRKALEQGNYFRKMAAKMGDFWTALGRFSGVLPKVAAYRELSKSSKFSKAYRANIVRTKIGQPGSHVKGKLTRSSNRLLTFSNTIIQDMRSNWHLMRRPTTRGGFAVSMIKQAFVPKLLIGGAAAGWFGAEMKEMYDAIPERDKRNSIPIPLGWEEGGEFGKRVHYINIPTDPTDRLFGALFYESVFGNEKEAQDRLKVAGETIGSNVPGINPTLASAQNIVATLFGGDPKDGFGRDILSRDEAMAGVLPRTEAYIRWQIGEFGKPGQALQGAIWDENLGQKTDWAPAGIPYLDRFIKSSDAGFAEKQRAGELAEDRGKARSRLAQGDATRELRGQYNRLSGLGERTSQQQKAYQDLKGWKALYDQQTQWVNMLDDRGQKAQADAARAKLEAMSQKHMQRFQATTGKRWK